MLTESILNFAWFAIALAASATVLVHRRDQRAIAALLCGLALLFPIISVSDDFSADQTLQEIFAVLVVIVAAVVLTALFRIGAATLVIAPLHRIVRTDPRSPPRG